MNQNNFQELFDAAGMGIKARNRHWLAVAAVKMASHGQASAAIDRAGMTTATVEELTRTLRGTPQIQDNVAGFDFYVFQKDGDGDGVLTVIDFGRVRYILNCDLARILEAVRVNTTIDSECFFLDEGTGKMKPGHLRDFDHLASTPRPQGLGYMYYAVKNGEHWDVALWQYGQERIINTYVQTEEDAWAKADELCVSEILNDVNETIVLTHDEAVELQAMFDEED